MIEESLGELARIQNNAISGAKWELIVGVLLLDIATHCLKRGEIWIPRTLDFAYKSKTPNYFRFQLIPMYLVTFWLVLEGLFKLHNLKVI